MFRVVYRFAFAITIALLFDLYALSQTNSINWTQRCQLPTQQDNVPRVTVDASRLNPPVTASFPRADRVEVAIYGKNPFKYAYRTTLATSPLARAIAADFFYR